MKTLLSGLLIFGTLLGAQAQSPNETVYVGTYSTRGSEGIYAFAFDRQTAQLRPLTPTKNAKSPSFLRLHPSGRFLYSANEAKDSGGPGTGSVSAYAVDRGTGALRPLNEQPSGGQNPCHISIDQTGKFAFVSNYGGSLSVLPINANGTLGAAVDRIQPTGSGPNKSRQESPHVHSAIVSPDNRFVYVMDLGTDQVYCYALDPKTGKLTPGKVPSVSVRPGSGPRHLAFAPNGRYAYLVEELTSSVAVLARDAQTGALVLTADGIATLPAGFTDNNTSADIHTDPTGKFLYQSNRGRNALAIFAIGSDGTLSPAGEQPVVKTPRNFLVDPKGEFVFVAGQDADAIQVFRRNAQTGQLTPAGQPVPVPAPVCITTLGAR